MAQPNRGAGAVQGCDDDGDAFAGMPVAAPLPAQALARSVPPGHTGAAIGSVLGLMLHKRAVPAARAADAVGGITVAPQALAVAGQGLDSDRHADPLSPRQVLLAGAPAYRRHGLAPHTLRENVLLDIDTAVLSSGTLLRLGDMAVVALTFHCEACGYLDARHPGVARAIGRDRGVLARVVQGGMLRPGGSVVQLPQTLPPWSDDWRERVAHILALVPEGMVVEYRQLARLAGVQAVYCRALPALARKLGLAERAVGLQSDKQVPRWMGENVFCALADGRAQSTTTS